MNSLKTVTHEFIKNCPYYDLSLQSFVMNNTAFNFVVEKIAIDSNQDFHYI